jgi:hypothetical protein
LSINNSFIKWSVFKFTDSDNPGILEFKVIGTETFDTEYSTCVKVLCKKEGEKFVEVILPLKAHNSTNGSLLRQWQSAVESGQLKAGKQGKILTWLDKSRNGNPIRRFKLVIA